MFAADLSLMSFQPDAMSAVQLVSCVSRIALSGGSVMGRVTRDGSQPPGCGQSPFPWTKDLFSLDGNLAPVRAGVD